MSVNVGVNNSVWAPSEGSRVPSGLSAGLKVQKVPSILSARPSDKLYYNQ